METPSDLNLSDPQRAEPKLEIETIAWSVRLGDQAPHRVLAIVSIATVGLLAGVMIWKSWPLGLLGFAMILGSTAEYWLGVGYRIGPEGVMRKVGPSVTSMNWSQVKRVVPEGDGWRFSPFAAPSKLDAFRGVLLRPRIEDRVRIAAEIQRATEQLNLTGGGS